MIPIASRTRPVLHSSSASVGKSGSEKEGMKEASGQGRRQRDSHVSQAWLGFSVIAIYCVQSRHAGQGARRTAGVETDDYGRRSQIAAREVDTQISSRSRVLREEPNTTKIFDGLQCKLVLLIHLLLDKLFHISICSHS